MIIIELLRRFKISRELDKHYKDHRGQIQYNRHIEHGTDKILKQEFFCVCGKQWEIDYGLNKMVEKGEIDHTEVIEYDWKPEKERERDSGQ